jgi:2-amino-4-hydroxy-6-hydroxymethyldihydropteridine diphosphokinase
MRLKCCFRAVSATYFRNMALAILSLGSNIRPRRRFIAEMVREVEAMLSFPVLRSHLMETEPVEVSEKQTWYLNRVMAGEFSGKPNELLDKCRSIEKKLGRIRRQFHGPRTADVDILALGDCIMNEPDLILPHPEFLNRRFCIAGAAEILPDFIIPGVGISLKEYYKNASKKIRDQALVYCNL